MTVRCRKRSAGACLPFSQSTNSNAVRLVGFIPLAACHPQLESSKTHDLKKNHVRVCVHCTREIYRQNADLVDQGLAENILRDSCDPGAIGVIAAGGKLPFSRSANEMLNKFGVRGERRAVQHTAYTRRNLVPIRRGESGAEKNIACSSACLFDCLFVCLFFCFCFLFFFVLRGEEIFLLGCFLVVCLLLR